MTTHLPDRPERSNQITVLVSIVGGTILAAVIAVTAFGGGGGADDPVLPPVVSPSPAAPGTPVPTPDETPEPTAVPAPDETPDPDDGPDAVPITVDLVNATDADVNVAIVDTTGLLVEARSGTPGEGISVETLVAENIDATTLKLTWSDFPIDNALALYVDEHEGGVRLLLVQPAPTGTTDAMGFDRELILSFSEPISAEGVETVIVQELDTPG